ncbi:hypothetical protein [Hubei chuvirus-like virus 3]|uniref:Nucleoprotein n=1 Tax=Hubei chuvirus-like virus 3 TaxID=1922858 RepID=A0A1L3KMZ2_9VIRU|nr:hypothetical protein [Hubei chuvirus-like virus 3]APG78726.1 hypothetical protein [Hubei chuvirus-like virus 3]
MARRIYGPADCRTYYDKWLQPNPLFSDMFVNTCGLDPFQAPWDDTNLISMATILWYGRAITLNPGQAPDMVKVHVAVWGDLFAPGLDEDRILTEEESRAMVVTSTESLLAYNNLASISDIVDARSFAEVEDDNATEQLWNNAAKTAEECLIIIRAMANSARGGFRIGGVTPLASVYVSIIKRGQVTPEFVGKIARGIAEDLGINEPIINPDCCQLFQKVFGDGITDTTMPALVNRWLEMLPQHALRLRLTVQQASGSGLTALMIAGKAMRLYHDFPWAAVQRMYPEEFSNFRDAVAAVGDNMWYGYRSDLGVVRSTRYPNITYIGKQLLIKINGEVGLRNYKGGLSRAKFQARVDTLISEYENLVTERRGGGEEVAADPIVGEVLQNVRRHADVYQ